jgi:hypothetical protein
MPFPIFKSSPQASASEGTFSTHPETLHTSAHALFSSRQIYDSWLVIAQFFSSYPIIYLMSQCLSSPPVRSYKTINTEDGVVPLIGKLGLKQEAAGKMRVFAMVDPWTQWVLKPLHDGIFKILRRHPMDGTFNQLRPLARAHNWESLYSLDLSSATDRLPITLQQALLSQLMGSESFAVNWANLLVGRHYKAPGLPPVKYAVGQPMGALSSWAMLAYTHHFILQCAA